MKVSDILNEEYIIESGISYKGTKPKKAKILYHNDMDGVFSAIAMTAQVMKQFSIKAGDVSYGDLSDSDKTGENERQLKKEKDTMLFVVDFNRFKKGAKNVKNIDVQTDHHIQDDDEDGKGKGKNFNDKYPSDTQHISYTMAKGFMNNSDIVGISGVDSASFGENFFTNHDLALDLARKDGVKNYKKRLAIIANALIHQLVRQNKTKNIPAVNNIIRRTAKSPTLINFVNNIKKYSKVDAEQKEILNDLVGEKLNKEEILQVLKFNGVVPRDMRIGMKTDKAGKLGFIKQKSKVGTDPTKDVKTLANDNARRVAKSFTKSIDKNGDDVYSIKTGKANRDSEIKLTYNEKGEIFKAAKWDKKEIKRLTWKKLTEKASKKQRELGFDDIPKVMRDEWGNAIITPEVEEMIKRQKRLKKLSWPAKKEYLDTNKADKITDPTVSKKGAGIGENATFGGEGRYDVFLDKTIDAAHRDYGYFWQMSLAPGLKNEVINLVSVSQKAFKNAISSLTIDKLKSFRFTEDEAKKLLPAMKTGLAEDFKKVGGHKSITTIGFTNARDMAFELYSLKNKGEKINKLKTKYSPKDFEDKKTLRKVLNSGIINTAYTNFVKANNKNRDSFQKEVKSSNPTAVFNAINGDKRSSLDFGSVRRKANSKYNRAGGSFFNDEDKFMLAIANEMAFAKDGFRSGGDKKKLGKVNNLAKKVFGKQGQLKKVFMALKQSIKKEMEEEIRDDLKNIRKAKNESYINEFRERAGII